MFHLYIYFPTGVILYFCMFGASFLCICAVFVLYLCSCAVFIIGTCAVKLAR